MKSRREKNFMLPCGFLSPLATQPSWFPAGNFRPVALRPRLSPGLPSGKLRIFKRYFNIFSRGISTLPLIFLLDSTYNYSIICPASQFLGPGDENQVSGQTNRYPPGTQHLK
jgi:hypothetical protein